MSQNISRRKLVTAGLATVAGASGLAVAARITERYGLIPPDHGGLYGVGETLTYASQRLLMSGHSMAREFDRRQISEGVPVDGKVPLEDIYQRLLAANFADWRLKLEGLVARPALFSLAELKNFPVSSHITEQACEEGWSFIAEWTGVQLSHVLNLAGVLPRAKFVVVWPFDQAYGFESIDMADALHPQTLLAYGMNGQDIPAGHGAPLRLKVPRQLGYKNTKYLSRIVVTDDLKKFGKGLGSTDPEVGYSWYAGI